MRAQITRWAAVAAWAAVIFAFSHTPGSEIPGTIPGWVAHAIEYTVLGALLFSARRSDASSLDRVMIAFAIASAYGITDEVHQAFVPLRTPDVADWLTDTAGALAGATTAMALARVLAKRRRGASAEDQ